MQIQHVLPPTTSTADVEELYNEDLRAECSNPHDELGRMAGQKKYEYITASIGTLPPVQAPKMSEFDLIKLSFHKPSFILKDLTVAFMGLDA